METYWFCIEPDTFLWKKGYNIMAYDSTNGNILKFEASDLWVSKYEELMIPDNLYCIELSDEDLREKIFSDNIKSLVQAGVAKLLPQKENQERLISFLPMIGVQRSRDKFVKEMSVLEHEDFLFYLQDITIYLNGDISKGKKEYKQIPYFLDGEGELNYLDLNLLINKLRNSFVENVKICGTNIFTYKEFYSLIDLLDQMHAIKEFYVSCFQLVTHADKIEIAMNEQFKWKIIVDKQHPFTEEIIPLLKDERLHVEWMFYVTSVQDCEEVEYVVKAANITKYIVKPLFTGENVSFFEDYIFLSEKDVLNIHLNKRQIFANQVLNVNDFGKLTIVPRGDIYANINMPVIGTLNDCNLQQLISNEIINGVSWLRTRAEKPCLDCLYQWLCQSPSNYEIVIGRSNLCHV